MDVKRLSPGQAWHSKCKNLQNSIATYTYIIQNEKAQLQDTSARRENRKWPLISLS